MGLGPPNWEKINIRFASFEETEGNVGLCAWFSEYKKVEIFILEEELHAQQEVGTIEETVVHELLHLVLDGHREKKLVYSPSYEHGLNVLARILTKRCKK